MPQAGPAPSQKLVTELKVSGHLMTLDQGLFCIYHAPGSAASDPVTGLPGVRITHPPMQDKKALSISSFNEDGWIGAEGSAALVRINEGPAQLLVTIYQNGAGQHDAPRLQVMRLGDAPAGAAVAAVPGVAAATQAAPPEAAAPSVDPATAAAAAPAADEAAEVAAHVQRRGDKLGKIGEWMGEPGSQSWIEGFAIAPNRHVGPADIEYQAVLGKGWLSPWSDGGQYCGSRGMALPILGLRVRLKGVAAETHSLRVSATFTDGSRVGPIADTETAEAESLAPLEAFRIEILPQGEVPSIAAEEDIETEAATGAAAGAATGAAAGAGAAPARRVAPAAKAGAVSRPNAKPASPAPKPGGKLLSKVAAKAASAKPGRPAPR